VRTCPCRRSEAAPGTGGSGAGPPPGPRLALALLAAAAALPAGAEPILRPSELASDEYAETFTFVADLDDGTYVQLQLAVTNLGPGSGTGLCRALVKRPGAAAWTSHRRYARSEWGHAVSARGETLSVGPCSAHSGLQSSVRVPLSGRAVELTFPEPLSERAAPVTIRTRDREYRSSILQAFTPVSARLDGFDAGGPLAGGGYADHSRGNVAPADLARRWVRFRALRPPQRLLALGRQRTDGTWDPAWIWREGEPLRALDAIDLVRTPAAPAGWTAALSDGSATRVVSSGVRLHRHAPLEELGPLGILVGAFMDVPVTHTFRATLTEPGTIHGILEVSAVGED